MAVRGLQYPAPRREHAHPRPALALIEEEARLLPVLHVDEIAVAVLLDHDVRGRRLSGEHAPRTR